ncbi:MAG TPA: hypothetical protein VG900_05425 [Hyphomicrobiaceae bacterium]|nr:hypothetical protein [Hyphomicrobiaceae bacterium]
MVRLAIAGLFIATVSGHVLAQAKRWAAIDPDAHATSPVVWSTTREKAHDAAVAACRRVSKSCAEAPASTDDLDDVFALMCCTRPARACAASPGAGREEARAAVQATLTSSGFSRCTLKRYISARTGEHL